MQRFRHALQSSLLILGWLLSSTALAQVADSTVVQRDDTREDTYLAGGTVYSLAKIAGDLVTAGGQITVENEVEGDILAAGGQITVRARVGDDVRAAGGNITLSGTVGDDAIIGAGTVIIAPTADIGGRAWLAGGNVEVHGKVGRSLRAAGAHIVIAGDIAGDVDLTAESIDILPGAVVGGSLRYSSPNEANIAPGARIAGAVARELLPARPRHERVAAGAVRFGLSVSLMLTAIVLFLLFPRASTTSARNIVESPWKSLGIGFALVAATPFAILILFATLIGAWLALIALALYLVLLLTGFLTGILCVGGFGLRLIGKDKNPTKGWHTLSIVAAFVALWIVGLVPILGGLVCFAILLFGLGGLALLIARGYVTPASATTTAPAKHARSRRRS